MRQFTSHVTFYIYYVIGREWLFIQFYISLSIYVIHTFDICFNAKFFDVNLNLIEPEKDRYLVSVKKAKNKKMIFPRLEWHYLVSHLLLSFKFTLLSSSPHFRPTTPTLIQTLKHFKVQIFIILPGVV